MHAHWLPGIDDGSPDMESSLEMIRGFKKLGYEKLIASPHVMTDFYPNTSQDIMAKLEEVKLAVRDAEIDIELGAAAEYLMDETFEKRIEDEPLLTFGDRHVLVEMSFYQPYPRWREVIFAMQLHGYRPVLAHPERYPYWDLKEFLQIREVGAALQLNLLSLCGYYGKVCRDKANKLLQLDLEYFLGSDMHHMRHFDKLESQWRELGKTLNNKKMLNHAL